MLVRGACLGLLFVVACSAAHPTPKGGASCSSDRDCSLTGSCSAGTCHCDAAWTGPACEHLHLLPAHRGALYPPTTPNPPTLPPFQNDSTYSPTTSPWGGAVIEEEASGIFHLFVTEYANHCPMTYGTWTFQASIRHATGVSANGPWEPQELVLSGSGNPVIVRAPDGTYVLYFTGVPRPMSGKAPPRNCTSADQRDWGPTAYCAAPANCATGLHLAHSASLGGPWTVRLDIVEGEKGATNPGAAILADGTVLFFYKSSATVPKSEVCPAGHCRAIHIARSPQWNALPYKPLTNGSNFGSGLVGAGSVLEDPSNGWVDNVRGAVHVLFHQGLPRAPGGGTNTSGCNHSAIHGIPASTKSCGYGGAAHSADNGSSWLYGTNYWQGLGWLNGTRTAVAYPYDLNFTDGGAPLGCIRREEPRVLLGSSGAADGQPIALVTQCTVAPGGMSQGPYPKSHPTGEVQWATQLMVQPINTIA